MSSIFIVQNDPNLYYHNYQPPNTNATTITVCGLLTYCQSSTQPFQLQPYIFQPPLPSQSQPQPSIIRCTSTTPTFVHQTCEYHNQPQQSCYSFQRHPPPQINETKVHAFSSRPITQYTNLHNNNHIHEHAQHVSSHSIHSLYVSEVPHGSISCTYPILLN